MSDSQLTVEICKVDRFEKHYSVGQLVDFKWSEWGEVRMLKKFIPPLPAGPPPVLIGKTFSTAANSSDLSRTPGKGDNNAQENEENTEELSLFDLFSDDIQRKKSSLSK